MKTTNQRQPYAEGYCSVCGEYTKFGKLTGRGLECPKECPPVTQGSPRTNRGASAREIGQGDPKRSNKGPESRFGSTKNTERMS